MTGMMGPISGTAGITGTNNNITGQQLHQDVLGLPINSDNNNQETVQIISTVGAHSDKNNLMLRKGKAKKPVMFGDHVLQ